MRPSTLPSLLVGGGLLLLLGACADPDPSPAPGTAGPEAAGAVPLFEPQPDWFRTPEGWEWGQVIGIYADARGHVWTSAEEWIAEWDPDGNLVRHWDARGPDGNWDVIHGLFVDHEGSVWTTARESHLVLKFTADGEVELVIGRFDETGGSNDTELMGRPAEIWVDPETSEAYIADGYGNRRVVVVDGATGAYLRHWGAYGEPPSDDGPPAWGPGATPDQVPEAPSRHFATVHGITGSRDGLIYVADRANNRIQAFRPDGTFVQERILRPRCGPEEEADWAPPRPCGGSAAFSIALSPDAGQEFLYVADGGSHVVTVLRRSDLEILADIGGPGVGPGEMGRPHNVTVDPSGNLFVAEAAGPPVTDPATGQEVQAGFRAQKLSFVGMGTP
jgi:DNA-binding beta-propeller fold protein YncE